MPATFIISDVAVDLPKWMCFSQLQQCPFDRRPLPVAYRSRMRLKNAGCPPTVVDRIQLGLVRRFQNGIAWKPYKNGLRGGDSCCSMQRGHGTHNQSARIDCQTSLATAPAQSCAFDPAAAVFAHAVNGARRVVAAKFRHFCATQRHTNVGKAHTDQIFDHSIVCMQLSKPFPSIHNSPKSQIGRMCVEPIGDAKIAGCVRSC